MTHSRASHFFGRILIVSILFFTVFSGVPFTYAAVFSTVSDTMTRERVDANADHLVTFTLPAAIDWDATGSNDDLIVDFPESTTDFVQSGTWQTSDFTANDGSSLTISAVNAAAGSLTYPSCGTDIVVAIDTTNLKFGFRRCTGTSATAATISLGILGASGGTGVLTNGTDVGSKTVSISMTDEGSAAAHTGNLAVSLVDDDSATVTATISPSLSFDIDTATSHIEVSGNPTPYSVALGLLTAGTVRTSNNTDVNSIYFDLATNAAAGAAVTVLGAHGGLHSAAASYTIATSYSGSSSDLSSLAEGFGLCVKSGSMSASAGSITASAPYASSCDATTHNIGGVDTSTPHTIINTAGAPAAGGVAEVLVKAKAKTTTPAASDYAETLTFIATGTF